MLQVSPKENTHDTIIYSGVKKDVLQQFFYKATTIHLPLKAASQSHIHLKHEIYA